jgi:hypothetical protein
VRNGDTTLALQTGYRKWDAGANEHYGEHRISIASRDDPQ